jgi:hypothetical protein
MFRSPIRFRFLAAGLMALLALPLAAQETKVYQQGRKWIEETSGSLPAAHSLRAAMRLGSVRVTGAAQANITYVIRKTAVAGSEAEARRQFARIRVIVRSGEPAVVATEIDGGSVRGLSVNADVTVPRDTGSVLAESGGGSVAVSSLAGRVKAMTGGGALDLRSITGPVVASTGGGSIRVTDVAEVKLSTGGGGVEVAGSTEALSVSSGGGAVRVASVSRNAVITTGGGGIEATKCGGSLNASTGGGSIDIVEIGGPATLETGGGSIRLGSAQGPVRASTGGGSIQLMKLASSAFAETGAGSITAQFVARRGSFADSVLHSGAGDIVVFLPPDLPVTVEAHIEAAMGHSIVTDFPEIRVSTEGGVFGPHDVSAGGSLNGGGPTLRIQTTLGSIQIRKLQP